MILFDLARKWGDFADDALRGFVFCDFQVVCFLQVEPKPRRGSKVARQAHGGFSSDGAASFYDCGDAGMRNAGVTSEPVLSQAHWLEEFLSKNFSRVDGMHFFGFHNMDVLVRLNYYGLVSFPF